MTILGKMAAHWREQVRLNDLTIDDHEAGLIKHEPGFIEMLKAVNLKLRKLLQRVNKD